MRFVFLSLLFALSAALITYWQTTRMTHFVDYSYQVEIAYRMFLGQVPYRDFFLVLTPGVYVVMSLVMKLTGGYSHLWVVLQSMMVSGLTSVVGFFVFWRITKSRWFTCLLSLALLPVGHAIYPYPNYDIWAVLFMLCAILCWTHLSTTKFPLWLGLFIGMFSAGSFLFKQTIGGTFAVMMVLSLIVVALNERTRKSREKVLAALIGEGLVFGLFLSWLWWQNAIGPFVRQVFVFPQSARDPRLTFSVLMEDYGKVLTLPPTVRTTMTAIWSLGMLMSVVGVLYPSFAGLKPEGLSKQPKAGYTDSNLSKRGILARNSLVFLLLVLLVTVHAGFLSQSIAGSHYGLWPLFYTMVAIAFAMVSHKISRLWINGFLGFGVLATTVFMTWYALTNEFTQYVNMKGPIATASAGKIKGLSSPGPWIPAFDSLLDDVKNRIPAGDRVAFLPGDDPFYAATNRVPVLRCSQWNTGTCDTFGFELEGEIRAKNVQWIIVKNQVMTPHAYPLLGWIPVDMGYRLEAHIAGVYDIYHRTL